MVLPPIATLFGEWDMGDKKSLTGFKIRNVLEALIVSIVLIVGVSSAIVVLTTGPEDSVQFIIGNETYIADETTNFNSITIDSSHIIFNNTGFYLTAPNDIIITLVYINDNVAGADDADKVVEFLADTSGGNVLFDLSGFPAGNDYVVKRDGESFSYPTADSSGYISFSSIVDEDKQFEILQVGDGVENNPPYAPSNPNPANQNSNADLDVILSWSGGDPDGDPVTYDVFFGSVTPPPQVSSGQSATTYDPGVMDYETTYYWKIVAWDDKDASTVGPVWEFTTEEEANTPPYEPNNPSPSDGATDEYVNIDISWVGSDPDGDPVTYDVYFGTTSNPPQVSSGQSATNYDLGTLDYDITYYWKIVAWDDKDASTVGPVWEFTTGSMQDTIPPEISDLDILFSNPIDTQIDFGWENFTCTVTDNVDVDDVFLNIIYPDSTTTDVSMINIAGTNQYYHNTSFPEHGNYGYSIWADDTSDNTDISSNYEFSVSPNWDVNQDGICDANDNSLVSSHYGETGAPGWIREDVDNNGQIQVFDLVLISINYGETW